MGEVMDQSARPLRVAYVLMHEPAYSETFIGSEIRAVADSGVTVEVFHARTRGLSRLRQAILAGTALLRHPVKAARHVATLGLSYGLRAALASAYALRLRKAVRAFDPDVIHTHFVNLPTAIAVLTGHELGRPVTALAHAADFLLDHNSAALDRRLRRLAHLFVISDAAAGQLAAKGVDMGQIPHSVVRAAFDGNFTPSRPAGGVPRVITIARLIEKKGIDTAVAAVGLLAGQDMKIQYDVYGDGPLQDALAEQIRSEGLTDVVRLHGATGHADAMAALAESDVAVLACRRAAGEDTDGIPVFLMEAAARGVPVVTTAVSGIPELVGPDGGWTVVPDRGEELADALAHVIAEPAEAASRAEALRERMRTEFSPRLQVERLSAVWGRLAQRAARG
jgi:glycosyltransferase involved in cell wall biosynthesis